MLPLSSRRIAAALTLTVLAGCSGTEPTGPIASVSSPRLVTTTSTRSYTSFGTAVTYGVVGVFHDVIAFTVPAANTYTFSVAGMTQIIACSGRYCMSPGTLKATISSVQLQTALGAPVGPIAGTTVLSLPAGDYQLVVDGAGVGTKRYANMGNYSVSIRAPVIVPPPSCDYIRDILQSQGYTDVQIEAMVAAMQAASPPKCTGD